MDARFACALTVWGAAALLPTAAFVACSGHHDGSSAIQSEKGSASVVALALSASSVVSATVTVSGGIVAGTDAGLAAPEVFTLQKNASGQWTANLTGLSAGTGFTFTVNAYDGPNGTGNVLYQGSATNVKIAAGGSTVPIVIVAQQVNPPAPFTNSAPVITSLVGSATTVPPSGQISLAVTANDPTGGTLTYAWSANGGTFSASNAATTTWTAPATTGNYGIILTVTDSQNATVMATTQISVANSSQAVVDVVINTWPVVTNVVGSPNYLVAGQATDLTVLANDADNDPITYAWTTSNCPDGTFGNKTSPTPTFTLPTGTPDTSCTFTVTASDGRGGSDTGTLTLPVGAPAFGTPIAFTTFSQTAASAGPGQVVTFSVGAVDPNGSPLTYTWLASGGTLLNQASTTSGSQINWTPPANAATSWTITVTAKDAAGLSATQTFTVTPSSCFGIQPQSTAWKFGIMADTQWTVTDDGRNPNSVAVSIINQLNQQFIGAGVQLVVAVGDVTDNGSNLALDTRALYAQALYNAGIGFFPLRGNHESSGVAAVEFPLVFPQTGNGGNNASPARVLTLTTPDDAFTNPVFPTSSPPVAFAMGTGFSSPSAALAGLSYTFTYNNAQFVLLDQFTLPVQADGGANPVTNTIDAQQSWISASLASKPSGGHGFVFAHKGIITENHVDVLFGSDPSQDPTGTDAFITSLAQNGVRYYIGGHDHMHNRSIVTTTDGKTASVQDIIAASDSSKFYQPNNPSNDVTYDVPAFGHTRQTQLVQEINTVGYYIVTINGPIASVDFYSAQINATGPGTPGSEYLIATTPPLAFVKRETFGYGLNGKEFIVAEGATYTTVSDNYAGTTAAILSGTNMNTAQDASGRALNASVDTGWAAATCATASSVLSLWVTPTTLGSGQTDTYALQLNAGATPAPKSVLTGGSFGLATQDANGNWINAVNKNYGGTKTFVSGPWTAAYGLGTYGVDPATGNAWAIVNYSANFAIAQFAN
jgi:hypothetical protein